MGRSRIDPQQRDGEGAGMGTVGSPVSRRRAGRPPRGVLSRDLITDAALGLIASQGYEGLTMAALAHRLRVAPSALYNHAESKQEVLRWVEDQVMAQVDFSDFAEAPWDEAVRSWAWSYRGVFAAHAPLISVIAVLPVTGAPETLAMYEAVTQGFLRAGWPEDRIIPAIVALESFIFGSAFDVAAPEDIFESGSLGPDYPLFTAAVRVRGSSQADSADAAFTIGLEALIIGLKAQLAT